MDHRHYTTEEIRRGWAKYCHEALGIMRTVAANDTFDDWLDRLKADAWDEGFTSAEDIAYNDAEPTRMNPYRKGE